MVKTIPLESGDVIVVNWNTIGHMAGWIETLFNASKNLPNCGAVTALALTPSEDIFFHGGFITPKLHVPVSYAMKQKYFGQYLGTREVEAGHFICAIIKKALLKKLPLPKDLGENPFVDADYSLEAQKLGFKIYATSNLIVKYAGQIVGGKSPKEFAQYYGEEYKKFEEKWGRKLDQRYKLPVMFHTSVALPTGFSIVAANYMRALSDLGVKVSYNFLKGTNEEEGLVDDETINTLCEDHGDLEMPQIVWGQAPYFVKNSGKYKIGFCEFEGDWLPKSWVEFCNWMDEIWCPTKWDREKFRKSGVNKPIYIFGQGIDPNYFHPEMSPMRVEAKESYKFICNAAWDPRKNLSNLILAFKNEFRKHEDVCLVLKTMNLGLSKGIKEELKKIKYPKDSAQVYVKEEALPYEQMGCFYTMGDCFVLPTRGEAWGLPLFEALACGVPVITTGWGAPDETLRDKKGKPYSGVHFIRNQKTITDTPYVYLQGNHWAEPSIPHLQELMRYNFDNRLEEKSKAKETGKIIRDKFSWQSVCEPMVERLKVIYRDKM